MNAQGAVPVDFAQLWRQAARGPGARRWAAEDDLAFWAGHGQDYDHLGGQPAPATASRLTGLIAPGSSVLDIGCGTGRFTLALARHGCRVTGLDHSSDMLALAREAATSARLPVRFAQASWPAEVQDRYDVALAAWSLYRQADLTTAIAAMAACADTVIAIDVAGAPSALAAEVAALLGRDLPACEPRATLLHGAMTQVGLAAEVMIVREERQVPLDAVVREAGWDLSGDEIELLVAGLADRTVGPGLYRDRRAIGIVVSRTLTGR